MSDFFTILLQALWLTLPAAIANMAPVIASRLNITPTLNRPLDRGAVWQGKRLLGANKTVRGLLWGVVAGALVSGMQGWVASQYEGIADVSLLNVDTWWYGLFAGALLGLATLLSDAAKSFFKRRHSLAPGESWVIIDQMDVVIGVTLVAWMVSHITFVHLVIIIVGGMFVTFIVSYIGVRLHIKEKM